MGNILIYGSCVTRDAYEGVREQHGLLGYVARQSMISAMSKPTALLPGVDLASAFQNRSLSGDLKSSLMQTVRRYAADADLLVMDLIDERLGVLRLDDGNYATDSRELKESGRLAGAQYTRIPFGTDEHFALWRAAAGKLHRSITAAGLAGKALVIEAAWAEVTDTGEPVPMFRETPIPETNRKYRRYYDALRRLGYRVTIMPPRLAVSTNAHKWGPDPFHYAEPAYQWMREQINATI